MQKNVVPHSDPTCYITRVILEQVNTAATAGAQLVGRQFVKFQL